MIKCRICGVEIDFVRTVNGGNMPVEPERVRHDDLAEGEIIITPGGNTIKVDSRLRMPSVSGYRPHWPSCAGGEAMRKKR